MYEIFGKIRYIIIVQKVCNMKYGKDIEDKDDIEFFGESDYSYENLPPEVEEVLAPENANISAQPKVSFDGEQFLIRIPKEIAELVRLKKGEKVDLIATAPPHTRDEKRKMKMYYPPKEDLPEDDTHD